MAPIAVVIVVAGISLFWGAALALYRRFAGLGVRRVLLFAGMLAGFEWVRGHILTGFPWDLPGETWAAGSAPSQAAALVGSYGLSWITVAIFATAGVVGDGRGGKIAAGLAAAATAGLYVLGAMRLAHTPVADSMAPWVRLVQPNVKQEASYDQALFVRIPERIRDTLAQSVRADARHRDLAGRRDTGRARRLSGAGNLDGPRRCARGRPRPHAGAGRLSLFWRTLEAGGRLQQSGRRPTGR